MHLARWHLFRFVASLTCIYHCTIKTCQPFVSRKYVTKKMNDKMHFLIQKSNLCSCYNFQIKISFTICHPRNKSYFMKKFTLLGKNQGFFSKRANLFESKKGLVTTLNYIAFKLPVQYNQFLSNFCPSSPLKTRYIQTMYPVVSAVGFLEMGSMGGRAMVATSSYLS